jgi:P-type Cu+ transporter
MKTVALNETDLPVARAVCKHCSSLIPHARRQTQFCCNGCERVYAFLNEQGLSDYYSIKTQSGEAGKVRRNDPLLSVASSASENDQLLDQLAFRTENHLQLVSPTLNFHVTGMHCTACVWLLEKLPALSPEVSSARVNLGHGTIRLTLSERGKFAPVLELIRKFGYSATPLLKEEDKLSLEKRDDRLFLLRIGVAAFCAGNVMLYSIGIYGGAQGNLGTLFRWLCIGLAAPAIFWSAIPFYRNAIGSLRAKKISIDLPISIALLIGFFESFRQALLGTNEIYLDSLTALVFLLLGSRYFLARLRKRELSEANLFHSILPKTAHLVSGNRTLEAQTEKLLPGDEVKVLSGETLPSDGELLSSEALLDVALMTGETKPQQFLKGETLFGGTKNLGGELHLRILKKSAHSKIGEIALKLEEKSEDVLWLNDPFINRIAEIFLWGVLGLASALVLTFITRGETSEGLRRALSLLIVACPCALALATPLTLSLAYRKLARKGVVLRSPDILLKASAIRTVFFDKTGTLTSGRPEVHGEEWFTTNSTLRSEIESAIYSLESESTHPIGIALARHLEDRPGVTLKGLHSVNEKVGQGIRGILVDDASVIEIRADRSSTSADSQVCVTRNGLLVATFTFRDALREDARSVVEWLTQNRYAVELLSGDRKAVVQEVANQAGIETFSGELSPEEKCARVELEKNALMIGDGANDALALKCASIGVAMQGSLAVTSQAAAVLLTENALTPLIDFFRISTRARQVLSWNFTLSILYNVIGATLAVTGNVNPLIAAIIMPVSSFSVLVLSAWRFR